MSEYKIPFTENQEYYKIKQPDYSEFDKRIEEIAKKLNVELGGDLPFDYYINGYSLTKLILAFLIKLDEKI